jgi:hypothetical protein
MFRNGETSKQHCLELDITSCATGISPFQICVSEQPEFVEGSFLTGSA